ncbi:MAG: sulfatase-like hydrolase/transferase [Planctomycetaceae bacterium]|nr:sulfatase-like hydrolase/transferase [Planctomycetaceae bacterium]
MFRLSALSVLVVFSMGLPGLASDQPNILWLTTEDIGPELGCYGDQYADTPNLDAFAKKSLLYTNAWSTAPVCAPARTTLISGMYPPSTGAEHMRSLVDLPDGFLMYPQYLRDAGYFCVNPGKEDYNVTKQGKVWDDADKKNLWGQLKDNQPFMAVLNHTGTHESKIRTRPHDWVHDPAKARIPAYHPDTKEVRQDWAQYYDNITVMDQWFADQLKQLEKAGLADETIVFFYGDHGSGMPRSKRWPYDSGLLVPFIVHVPEKFQDLAPGYQAGGTSDRLIGFIDCAQTVISLAGAKPPRHMQGHAFLGKFATVDPKYAFGFRGRMDERYDMVRTVRNQRYQYIRNYMPHRPYGQHVNYMFITPTTRVWKALYDSGEANEAQSHFWKEKPPEELYDLEADPDEVHNLVDSPEHQGILQELRTALLNWELKIRDVGFLPEQELHDRVPGLTPYELGHADPRCPLAEIIAMAERASSLKAVDTPDLVAGLRNSESAIRYWAAQGLLARKEQGVQQGLDGLKEAIRQDASPSVRTIAAEAVAQYGPEDVREEALNWLIEAANGEKHGPYVAILAMNAIDHLDGKAVSLKDQVAKLPTKGNWVPSRGGDYVPRLIEKTLADLQE